MLSAPQYYIELMRDLYVRFPEYMEPSSDIQTSAHHGQVFTTALDKTFYEKEVHLEVTNPKGGTSKVLDEVAMKERRMRSQRNHNQSDLLSILAYFRTWRTISGTVGDLQAKISEFDRMKD